MQDEVSHQGAGYFAPGRLEASEACGESAHRRRAVGCLRARSPGEFDSVQRELVATQARRRLQYRR